MPSFWKTVADVGRLKLEQLGAIGIVLGIIWVLGIGMWWDFTMGAYAEGMPGPGGYYAGLLIVWVVLGLAIYLWRDPHGIRTGETGSVGTGRTAKP